MSVGVRAYSNHGLQIDDYYKGISLIEDILKIKIENLGKSDLGLTEDKERIVYFTNHEYFSKRFDEGWGIWIFSNFRICDQIRIYKHFIDFSLSGKYNLKTHIWRDLIAGKALEKNGDSKNEMDETLTEWNRTRNYIKSVTKKLQGDIIIYINDSSNEHKFVEETIWEGKDSSVVLNIFKRFTDPIEYHNLEKGQDEFSNANWFIERL
jgi:hypothetical protein